MRGWRLASVIAAAALVASGVAGPADAAQKRGDLDASWGNAGVATTSFPALGTASAFVSTRDSLIQPDGKVVVVGAIGDDDYSTFAIARFTTDGLLDPTFSADGMLQVSFQHAHAAARSVAMDSQGRLLVTGVTSPSAEFDVADTRLALVRLLPNGVPDPAFGDLGNGRVRISFAGRITDGRGVVIAPGDRPVCVGTETAGGVSRMALFRFTESGLPDNSFNLDGHLEILSATETFGRKAVMSGDVLYATGWRQVAAGIDQPVIVKILGSGTPDLGFGIAGVQPLALQGTSNWGLSIALPPTDPPRINIGVESDTGAILTPMMATTTMAGALSADYGVAGVFTGGAGTDLRDADVASDGSSVLVGANEQGTLIVTAVRPDGAKDTSFAGGGSTSPLPESVFRGGSVSLAPSGDIFVGGSVATLQMALIKLHGTATPDPSPTPSPAPSRPTITGLSVGKSAVEVSIAPQTDATGFTYMARKMKPNGSAGKMTASGALPAGATSLTISTPGAMHGLHLSLTATGPGGSSQAATQVWGRRTTGRVGSCKPVRVTKVRFAAKTRVWFPKRKNACARLVVGKRSRVVRKGKTSIRIPTADRAVFRAGRARTVLVLR